MRPASLAFSAAGFVIAASQAALAQGAQPRCPDYAAEATEPSRDQAMRSAFEAVLIAHDRRLLNTWAARGSRIGDVPGHNVTRLVTRCSSVQGRQQCRIEVTICRS